MRERIETSPTTFRNDKRIWNEGCKHCLRPFIISNA